jgi:hypothetical protein
MLAEGVRSEALFRQRALLQIAACDAGSADVDLAIDPERNEPPVPIEKPDAQIL